MDRQRVRSRKGDAQIVCNHRPAFPVAAGIHFVTPVPAQALPHGPADRQHHVTCSPRWTTSPLRQSLSFWYTQPTIDTPESSFRKRQPARTKRALWVAGRSGPYRHRAPRRRWRTGTRRPALGSDSDIGPRGRRIDSERFGTAPRTCRQILRNMHPKLLI